MNDIRAKFEAFEQRLPKRRAAFGLNGVAVIELVAFFVLAFVVDLIFFGDTRFQGLEPHPFWIPVILLAAQYGSAEGLLAAVTATAALLLGALPDQAFGQDVFDYLAGVTALPLMWCVSAIVIGELAARRRRRLERTERQLLEVREEADGLADAYAQARATKDRLEARLAGELRTTLALYEGARAVERSSPGDVLRGAVDLVRGVLGPEKFSIYLLNGDMLEAAVQEGWTPDDAFARALPSDHPVFQAIIAEGRRLCVAYRDDAETLDGEGLLAAPLAGGPGGQPVGMLKIEGLSFAELTTSAIENFRLAAEWIGSALERAQRQEALASGAVTGDGGDALSAALYAHESQLLAKLGARFGFDTARLIVEAENAHRMSQGDRQQFAEALAGAADEALRETDLTFELGRHGRRFAILLPGADMESAWPVAERLQAALARRAPAAVTVGAVTVRPEMVEAAA